MKLQKLTSTAILGALALSLAAPTVLAGPAESLSGKGTIQYKENDESDDKDTENVTDPENPEEDLEIDEENGENNNDEKGTLRVDYLSHLKFGEQKVQTSAGEYFATPTIATVKETGKEVKRGNFVNVTDQRASGTPQGWTLTATVETPFTNKDGEILKGAQITYSNPFVNAADTTSLPVAENLVVLETTGNVNTPKMASAVAGTGWGSYSIEYGRPSLDDQNNVVEDGTGSVKETMSKSIKLNVPANTPLDITTPYEAKIVWTMAQL